MTISSEDKGGLLLTAWHSSDMKNRYGLKQLAQAHRWWVCKQHSNRHKTTFQGVRPVQNNDDRAMVIGSAF